jgi:hypothetical protein
MWSALSDERMSPAGIEPENDCPGEDQSNSKRQTHPLVREDVT